MHSGWFNGIEILQGRWQHGEKVGYCYPSGLEKTLCKWGIYVPLVTKGLKTDNQQRVLETLYLAASSVFSYTRWCKIYCWLATFCRWDETIIATSLY
jgi:hypothetical protein